MQSMLRLDLVDSQVRVGRLQNGSRPMVAPMVNPISLLKAVMRRIRISGRILPDVE